jgi:hypothetical protein
MRTPSMWTVTQGARAIEATSCDFISWSSGGCTLCALRLPTTPSLGCGAINLLQHSVVDLLTEHRLDGFEVRPVAAASVLYAVRQARGEIAMKRMAA